LGIELSDQLIQPVGVSKKEIQNRKEFFASQNRSCKESKYWFKSSSELMFLSQFGWVGVMQCALCMTKNSRGLKPLL
jgi:hypothetical protein